MSVPAPFQTVIDGKLMRFGRWIQIEGIPYGYGNFSSDETFFTDGSNCLGIKRHLVNVPKGLDEEIDVLEGGSKASGALDFEIADIDGEPTKWTLAARLDTFPLLAAAVTKTATSLTYVGDGSAITVGSYVYIENETVYVTAHNTGTKTLTVIRGMFRSRAYAWGAGVVLGTQPYSMANRRLWYYEVAAATEEVPTYNQLTNAWSDNDQSNFGDQDSAVLRLAGQLTNYRASETLGSYILEAQTLSRELDRKCFRQLRTFKLWHNIMDAQGKDGDVQCPGYPNYYTDYNKLYNFDGDLFSTSEQFLCRIDDEIFWCQMGTAGAASPYMSILGRGLLNTEVQGHKAGTEVREVVGVIEYLGNSVGPTTPMQFSSKFTSEAPTSDTEHISADHPLLLVLQVLLSTGDGTNTPGGGSDRNYDVLPASWGMGIEYTRVDIAGIEAAAREEPQLRFSGIIEEPPNFTEFCRQLLRFSGYYYIVELGDTFTIKRRRPPFPDVTTRSITNAQRNRSIQPRWEANWTASIHEVIFKYGWDIVNNRYTRIIVYTFADSTVYVSTKGTADGSTTKIAGRSLTFESKFLYPGGGGVPGEGPLKPFDVDAWTRGIADYFNKRYARPPPIVHERVDYSYMSVEVGDVVTINATNTPDAGTGARGLTAAVGEVIQKSVDEGAHVVDLAILMTGWQLGDYRFIGPSGVVVTANPEGGGVYTLELDTNIYTLPAEGTDINPKDSIGTAQRVFKEGRVYVWKSDFSAKTLCDIQSDSSTEIVVAPVTTWAAGMPAVGNIVTHADYDDQTVSFSPNAGGTFASAADSNNTLGAHSAKFHKYFPT